MMKLVNSYLLAMMLCIQSPGALQFSEIELANQQSNIQRRITRARNSRVGLEVVLIIKSVCYWALIGVAAGFAALLIRCLVYQHDKVSLYHFWNRSSDYIDKSAFLLLP